MTTIPDAPLQLWPRWKHWPDDGTIAHVLQTGGIRTKSGGCAALPGGFFVRCVADRTLSSGMYRVLTLPSSAMRTITMSGANWDWTALFEGNLSAQAVDTDWGVSLEIVPDTIANAVEATLKLFGFNEATDQPIVVDDGWLV